MHGANLEQKEEAETREAIFAPYQVNSKMMASAGAQCRLLHCLPAERGREVTDDVMEDESRYGVRPCGIGKISSCITPSRIHNSAFERVSLN